MGVKGVGGKGEEVSGEYIRKEETISTHGTGEIAAVDEYGTSVDLFSQSFSDARVSRPDRCSETEFAIIHQPQCFLVVAHFHYGDHRPKRLVVHYEHVMAHARQEGRFDIIAALRGKLKRLVVRGHIDGAELERVINVCVDVL